MPRKPKRAAKSKKRAKPRRKSSTRKVARKSRTKPRRKVKVKSRPKPKPKAKPKKRPASRRVGDADFDRFVARILRAPAAPRAKPHRFQLAPTRACAICGEPTDHDGDGHPYEVEEKE